MVAILLVTGAAALAGGRPAPRAEPPGARVALALDLPTATPSPAPTAEPTPTPTPTPDFAPIIDLRSDHVGQGETMLVWVSAPAAASGQVEFLGRTYPLIAEDGVFWAVVGAGLNTPLGPAPVAIRLEDSTGATILDESRQAEVVHVERPVDHLTLTAGEASILTPEASATEARLRAEQFSTFDLARRWDGPLVQPTDGVVTTEFGQARSINGGPVGGGHSGMDIANVKGTLIHAAAPGRVAWVGTMPIRGNTVLIDHGAGVMTGYHHLLEPLVQVGQQVAAGEVIAKMGSTGFSTGPHLHWELTIYGVNVDPFTWTLREFTP